MHRLLVLLHEFIRLFNYFGHVGEVFLDTNLGIDDGVMFASVIN